MKSIKNHIASLPGAVRQHGHPPTCRGHGPPRSVGRWLERP